MTDILRRPALRLSSSGIEQLNIAKIRRDGGTQPRAGLDENHVQRLAEAIQTGEELPPVVVFYDGSNYWLADGFHRVKATVEARGGVNMSNYGTFVISADVRQGGRRDAVLYSVGANRSHGLPRSRDDTRRAIETLLRDEEWGQWSDREIARQVGCSDKTVAAARQRLGAEIPHLPERKGSDGKVYQVAPKVEPDPLAWDAYKKAQPPAPAPAPEPEEPATRPHPICSYCGADSGNMIGKLCQDTCYHISRANEIGPTDTGKWHVDIARIGIKALDNERKAARLSTDLDMLETYWREHVEPPKVELTQEQMLSRIEATYSELIERLRPDELRLLDFLLIGETYFEEPDETEMRDGLWEYGRGCIKNMLLLDALWVSGQEPCKG